MLDVIEKREFWSWLDRYKSLGRRDDLKAVQDAFIVDCLDNVCDKRILEIGGGNSRVLEILGNPGRRNECWNAEKFEGEGNGPTENTCAASIKLANCFLGEFSPELQADYFDYVFSISVVEHVPAANLEAFFKDCARVLKPGGTMLHAIDVYVYDADLVETKGEHTRNRIKQYLAYVDRPDLNLKLLEPPKISENLSFSCRFASNSDKTMYLWNRIAPSMASAREVAQAVSLKAEWRKSA